MIRYALEGLNVTQFYEDNTVVVTTSGEVTTATAYISKFYQDWHYSNVGYDVMALLIFIVALRCVTLTISICYDSLLVVITIRYDIMH